MTLQTFTLGTFAQQGVAAVSYESIATVSVGAGGTSTVTFSSIPATYAHLQLRVIARSNNAGNIIYGAASKANNDSGSNYTYHFLYGNGSSAQAIAATSQTSLNIVTQVGNGFTSNVFAANVIDILDYANTNKYKTFRILSGADGNGSGQIQFNSALWMSTSAINSISFTGGDTFLQYSHFALYGIKVA